MGKADQIFNTTRSHLDQEWSACADWMEHMDIGELVTVWGVLVAPTLTPNLLRMKLLGMNDQGLAIVRRLLNVACCESVHRVQERERIRRELPEDPK